MLTPEQQAAAENTPPEQLYKLAKRSRALARIVAGNPNADPELLRLLAKSDRATREEVASNPNAPVDVLLTLGAEFPCQFLENPIFPLLLLENPNLVSEIPIPTLCSLIQQPDVPPAFTSWVMEQSNREFYELKLALAQSSATPEEILEQLASNSKKDVRMAHCLIQNPSVTGKTLERLTQHEDAKVLQEVAKHPKTPAVALLALAEGRRGRSGKYMSYHDDDYLWIDIYLAENANAPAEVLEKLSKVGNYRHFGVETQLRVARNLNTPDHVLLELAGDKQAAIRQAVCMRPDISENLIIQLCLTRRAALRENLNLSSATLERLANRNEPEIQKLVAAHPNTPAYILQQWFEQSKSYDVIHGIASNVNTPESVLEQIVDNGHFSVYMYLVQRNSAASEKVLDRIAKRSENAVHDWIAKHPNTSANTLQYIAQKCHNIHSQLWKNIDKHPNTPAAVLEYLAEYSWHERQVAQHPNTPAHVLAKLAKSDNQYVREDVERNPNTPVETLIELTKD